MNKNVLSMYNFTRLATMSIMGNAYNENNEETIGVIPTNFMKRIEFIIKNNPGKYQDIIDEDVFLNYGSKWEQAFITNLRETVRELKLKFSSESDYKAAYIIGKKDRVKELIEELNLNELKDEMNEFTSLLTNPFLMDVEESQKLGM